MSSCKIEYLIGCLNNSCEQQLNMDLNSIKTIITNCISRVKQSPKLNSFQKSKIIIQLEKKKLKYSQIINLICKLMFHKKLKLKDLGNLLLFNALNKRDVLQLFSQIENSLTSLRSQSKCISVISHFRMNTKIPKFRSGKNEKPELDLSNLEKDIQNLQISKL